MSYIQTSQEPSTKEKLQRLERIAESFFKRPAIPTGTTLYEQISNRLSDSKKRTKNDDLLQEWFRRAKVLDDLLRKLREEDWYSWEPKKIAKQVDDISFDLYTYFYREQWGLRTRGIRLEAQKAQEEFEKVANELRKDPAGCVVC